MLTYAIGDIHGRLDLLLDLLAQIETDAGDRPRRLVFIGDYIDRGPDSAGVIAKLRELQAGGAEVVCLKGNHEDLLLKALERPEVARNWLYNGGDATLASYGAASAADLPADDLAWLAALPVAFEDERRCYVHAGLRPDVAREAQRDHDRLWIRDEFLSGDHDFGRYVVHGHTPRIDGRPDVRPHRVNIDTAAVYGGRLTAAVFDDEADRPRSFLHAPG